MHPLVLYIVATDLERNHRADAEWNRRPRSAPIDTLPPSEPAPVSRLGRLTAILRRRVARATSA